MIVLKIIANGPFRLSHGVHGSLIFYALEEDHKIELFIFGMQQQALERTQLIQDHKLRLFGGHKYTVNLFRHMGFPIIICLYGNIHRLSNQLTSQHTKAVCCIVALAQMDKFLQQQQVTRISNSGVYSKVLRRRHVM